MVGERFVVICVSSEHNLVIGVHFVTVGLLSEDFTGEPKALEPEEITEWRWFPLNDLPENLFPPSRKIVNNYLAGTFYTLE